MQLPIIETYEQSAPARRDNSSMVTRRPTPASVEATFEFGRFRVLPRRRQLLSDGYPVELGTRAFDLLLVLLEADGSLVTKGELLNRVWPGIVVTEGNLKVQVSALRRAFGQDRDFIRTEFGRGYRFAAVVQSTVAQNICQRKMLYRSRSDGASCFRQQLVGDHCTVCAPQSPVSRGLKPTPINHSVPHGRIGLVPPTSGSITEIYNGHRTEKVAVITGASGGIGTALVKAYRELGMRISGNG